MSDIGSVLDPKRLQKRFGQDSNPNDTNKSCSAPFTNKN